MKRSVIIVILCLLAGVAVCFSPASAFAQDFIVGEGDVLKVTVYGHSDLDATVRIGGDGSVVMPLLGPVEVTGLPVSEIAKKMTGLFADGYLINPQVSVFVEEFRSKRAVILGQVQKPGLYELPGQTTLLELISKAGGLKEDAGAKVVIKRKSGAGTKDEDVVTIDLKRLVEQGEISLNLQVQDGDSIYINKAGVFFVTGEVKKPASYKVEEDTTVIKAITMAGGLTDKASATNIKIIRKKEGREEIFQKVKMDDPVLPDDVIVVPESFF